MEEGQVVAQIRGRDESLTHPLAATRRELGRRRRIAQNLAHAYRALLRALNQITGDAVLDLQRDAADIAADYGPLFPKPFRNGEPEALAQGFLQDDAGVALEGVDLKITDAIEVRKQMNIGVSAGV